MEEETEERIARAVLLFCALVVVGVAAYTTFVLFSENEVDISFSPPDAAEFSLEGEGGDESTGTASFVIEKEKENEEGKSEVFKTEEINPAQPSRGLMPSPLVIAEDVDGKGRLVFIVIALEIVLIFLVYRVLDKRLRK